MEKKTVLKLNNICKSFSGTKVLHGVNLTLKEGEILGVVGENGAGKSTMMSIIGGLFGHDSGSMMFNGNMYNPKNPADAREAGIAFVHQEFSLFTNMSIADNLFLDNYPHNPIFAIKRNEINLKAKRYLEMFGVNISPKTKVEQLSMGMCQIIEITKAIAKKPKVIIFDEPTTSLSPKEKEFLFEVIKKLKSENTSIIYISHILDDVISLCGRVFVLRDGRTAGELEKDELDKRALIKLMVGRELSSAYPETQKKIGDTVYEVLDYSRIAGVAPISLKIRQGEIVGLFGLMGAGRTELLNALYGIEPNNGGTIYIDGEKIERANPKICIEHGMAYITENRRHEGLVVTKPVGENLVMVILDKLLRRIKQIDRKKEKQKVEGLVKQFSIKTIAPQEQEAIKLSGGNQQKVVIAKWCASSPKVFFMDEPTRGVDVGAKYEIYSFINDLAKSGCGILLVSSEMEELMGMCDRIMVMHKNLLVTDIKKENYASETIIQYALEGRIDYA